VWDFHATSPSQNDGVFALFIRRTVIKMAPTPGLEPGTTKLTVSGSTIELDGNKKVVPRAGIEPT
jgi:hypothetical protein